MRQEGKDGTSTTHVAHLHVFVTIVGKLMVVSTVLVVAEAVIGLVGMYMIVLGEGFEVGQRLRTTTTTIALRVATVQQASIVLGPPINPLPLNIGTPA